MCLTYLISVGLNQGLTTHQLSLYLDLRGKRCSPVQVHPLSVLGSRTSSGRCCSVKSVCSKSCFLFPRWPSSGGKQWLNHNNQDSMLPGWKPASASPPLLELLYTFSRPQSPRRTPLQWWSRSRWCGRGWRFWCGNARRSVVSPGGVWTPPLPLSSSTWGSHLRTHR